MSDEQRGDAQAQGFFAHMLQGVTNEMEMRGRSPEYVAQFWKSFEAELSQFCGKGKAMIPILIVLAIACFVYWRLRATNMRVPESAEVMLEENSNQYWFEAERARIESDGPLSRWQKS